MKGTCIGNGYSLPTNETSVELCMFEPRCCYATGRDHRGLFPGLSPHGRHALCITPSHEKKKFFLALFPARDRFMCLPVFIVPYWTLLNLSDLRLPVGCGSRYFSFLFLLLPFLLLLWFCWFRSPSPWVFPLVASGWPEAALHWLLGLLFFMPPNIMRPVL